MDELVRVGLPDRARTVPYDISDLLVNARFGAVSYGSGDRLRVAGCLNGVCIAAGFSIGAARATSLDSFSKRLPHLTTGQVS